MQFITNVDKEKFNEFAIACPLNHYTKTSYFGDFKAKDGYQYELCGVEDDQHALIATALLMFTSSGFPKQKYGYISYGFNLDINNKELITYFANCLKEEAKKQGCIFLRMDSNITRLEHEKDGKVKENGFNHEYVTELLEECGYHHLGYNYGYSGNWLSRFTYRNDLDMPFEQVKKGIKRCNVYTKKNELRHISVRKATREDLPILMKCQKELSHQRGFEPKPISYFERMYDYFEPFVHFYVVSTNYGIALSNLEKEVNDLTNKMTELKDEHRLSQTKASIEALNKEINEMKEKGYIKNEEVYIGAKFIIMQGVNVYNVNMYTTKTLVNFRAAFALHMFALEDLYQLGAKTYDFEGISGSLDPKDPYWGQQDFKKSFGGDFLEFLGEFDCVFNQKKYDEWRKSARFIQRAKRKVKYLVNKKK